MELRNLVNVNEFQYLSTQLAEHVVKDVNRKFQSFINGKRFDSRKFRPIAMLSFGDVVQINSSDWYVWTEVKDKEAQAGYWRPMTEVEQLEYSK